MNKDWSVIIEACIQGSRSHQQMLYHHFADRMYLVCLQYTKDESEAQDLLQEGFIKVFGKLSQYRFLGSFEGWVRKIFVNTALENFRSQRVRFVDFEQAQQTSLFVDEDIIDQISSEDVLKIVQSLSPQYRMVFNLYAIEGYNHKEIADMLGISEGTSKSNYHRAKIILQTRIRQMIPFDSVTVNQEDDR